MNPWNKLRIPVLIFTFASAVLVFGRTIVDPGIGRRTATRFVFPSEVPLPQWQFVASKSLPNQTIDELPYGKLVLPGMQYSYKQNGIPLEIKMRYEVNTSGDVKQSIENFTDIRFTSSRPMPNIRKDKQVGFYGVFADEQQAYLDACINPRGGSTFTSAQFDYNRVHYDVQLQRVLFWIFGRQELRDNRCLWTHLSIPLNQSDPESVYVTLEQAWFSWYKWWHSRFPKN